MTRCQESEVRAHGERDHHCIGEHGHSGPHWCLLGHVWPATEEDAS